MHKIVLSPLGHTWLLDIDGTLVKHNGYKNDGYDSFLDGAVEFLQSIPDEDMIVFITSRKAEYKGQIENFLVENDIRFNHIICGAPYGERILVNDIKPSGLKTALAVNLERDTPEQLRIEVDESL
jgi:hypothetical protein